VWTKVGGRRSYTHDLLKETRFPFAVLLQRMSLKFSLVLSKGTHLVSEKTFRTIVDAIESGTKVVQIPVDRFHDGNEILCTLVTAHVVALFPIQESLNGDLDLPLNVVALSAKRL
jgi:hypothetical protein